MAKQNKGRKFFAASATAALVASAIVPVASAAQVNDYNKISGYAKEAVQSLVDKGVIQGDTNGNFNPLNTVTRAQAAEIFTKALELEADGEVNFKDVKAGAWYYNSIAAVVANGIFEGVSATEFAPNKSLTRSEAAKVLVDAFGLEGSESLGQFADASQVKPWAKSALETAVANGIFTGSEENGKLNLKPNAAITRQDFAVVFARTLDLVDAETPVDASIKAINNTTVEVTFDEEVDTDNVTAGNFKIDGLEVKNAAIKQTNKKVVVLTTAAQTADKEYVLSYKDEEIGKFKGIASVIPTAIKMVTPSVQGTIGKEATVSAQVTVPEGQSKAGIPVTFNIAADTNNQLNQKIEVVAYTNEEGIASYSYTRYYKYNDQVTAYASEKSSVYASAKVYWAEGLTITEATTGNDLANGAKKVYKIKTDKYNTQYVGTSNTVDYNYVNVAFKENVDVAPDKLVRDVEVIDTGLSTNAKYPSQVTTGGVNVVRVKVNSNGEATFTLTGSNASVTPIVFVDESKNLVGKYTDTALQAAAPTVKFALNHTLGLTVKAEGVQNAAAINLNNDKNKGTGQGGRTYTVTVTDKDGKVAPAGTKAYVTFADGSYSTDKEVKIVSADGKTTAVANKNTRFEIVVTGTKGEATFDLIGQRDAFAAPTVYLENGKEVGLDKADLQTVGETTYFVDAVIANATLKVKNADGKEVKTLPTSQTAYFEYQSVDQNGFDYYAGTGVYEVSYQVTAQFADVTVTGNGATKTVKAGTTETVKINAVNGKATLNVNSTNVASNVSVQASASQVSLPNQTATLAFTKGTQVPDLYTGIVEKIDTVNNKLKFVNFDEIKYSTTSFKNQAGVVISETEFEKQISDALAAKSVVKVTSVLNTDGTYNLEIASITASANVPVDALSAVAVDSDRDGNADQVVVTFSKAVDETKLATADFTIAGATVASIGTDANTKDNKVTLNITGVTGLSVNDLVVSAKPTVGVDLSNLSASTIKVAPATALPGFVKGITVTPATVADGAAGTKQVLTLVAAPATGTGDAIATVVGNGISKNIPVAVVAGDTKEAVAAKVFDAVKADATVNSYYEVTYTAGSDTVTFTNKNAGVGNATDKVTVANQFTAPLTSTTVAGTDATGEVTTITGFTGTATAAGKLEATITKGGTVLKTVSIDVVSGATGAEATAQLYAALYADETVKANYIVSYTGSNITLTNKVPGVVAGTANATSVTIQP
ncbi:S-layer homology domain-containing protein [Lysinibacillus sp.]|uniref:S-layer homology domain-containing protein n=1 Tax=Lysinibacillus sp. TaxID=1869345 RepID=UPI0028AF601F|nr:S-layer homology domain-containing protein [Lysinibacillus sp.]